ncbi:MAG: phage holin family protein [Daejeonella sp.]
MKLFIQKLLKTFDYNSWTELAQSLVPSSKYHLSVVSMIISALAVSVDKIFGLDGLAFSALLIVFVTELISGIGASNIRGDQISSMKLSRFTFKVFYYLVLIAVPYLMSNSFKNHSKDLAAIIFDWLHIFLVVQIVLENMISILENLAVISGKDKTHWINKIQTKINTLLS